MLDGLFFGTATQGEAARRGRPRGAVREQEDEDAQGHDDGLRRRAAAPAELRAAVCSALAEQACDRRPCGLLRSAARQACDRVRRGLREVERVRSAATARGSKSGGTAQRAAP